MSRNVDYGVQRELNFDMGTNYCIQEGHLLGEHGEKKVAPFGTVLCSFAFV
jgi:hypothetical protein